MVKTVAKAVVKTRQFPSYRPLGARCRFSLTNPLERFIFACPLAEHALRGSGNEVTMTPSATPEQRDGNVADRLDSGRLESCLEQRRLRVFAAKFGF